MKFLALIAAAQLATALPLAKDAKKECPGTDVVCKGQEAIPQITNSATEGAGNAPLRSTKRDLISDALKGIDMSQTPDKGEPVPARPSEHGTVTPTSEDASNAVPDMYEETYNTVPEAGKDFEDSNSEVTHSLSERTIFDDLDLGSILPGPEDSYEENKPEVSSAAYHAAPTPSNVYGAKPSHDSHAYEAIPTPSAYHADPIPVHAPEAAPTPSDVYGAVPVKPSKVYEAASTPSDVYGGAPSKPSMVHEAAPIHSDVYGAAPAKPSKVHEAAPTPSDVYGAVPAKPSKAYEASPAKPNHAYEASPTPSPTEDSYESTHAEDTYDPLGLDLDLGFRKN